MPAEAQSACAGLLRQQAEQAATALGALPSVTLADVKTHVSGPRFLLLESLAKQNHVLVISKQVRLPRLRSSRSCQSRPQKSKSANVLNTLRMGQLAFAGANPCYM